MIFPNCVPVDRTNKRLRRDSVSPLSRAGGARCISGYQSRPATSNHIYPPIQSALSFRTRDMYDTNDGRRARSTDTGKADGSLNLRQRVSRSRRVRQQCRPKPRRRATPTIPASPVVCLRFRRAEHEKQNSNRKQTVQMQKWLRRKCFLRCVLTFASELCRDSRSEEQPPKEYTKESES